jgi:hypothetical protein
MKAFVITHLKEDEMRFVITHLKEHVMEGTARLALPEGTARLALVWV